MGCCFCGSSIWCGIVYGMGSSVMIVMVVGMSVVVVSMEEMAIRVTTAGAAVALIAMVLLAWCVFL